MVSKQKILIVDDDNNIAELISLYLTKECFDTMIVNDGESVMPAMETFAPNLILLDLMLPGIDGYQVCAEKSGHNTPFPSSCFPQKVKSSTRYWDWSWVRMIIWKNLLIPRNWWPAPKQSSDVISPPILPQKIPTTSVWNMRI